MKTNDDAEFGAVYFFETTEIIVVAYYRKKVC
jgi:hypothetical protein